MGSDEEGGAGKKRAKPALGLKARIKKRWRAWLRACHRDIGYLAVGLTFVYAISGIAINHLGDWNPDFARHTDVHQIAVPSSLDDEDAVLAAVQAELGIEGEPRDFFIDDPGDFFFDNTPQLEIEFDKRRYVADLATGRVFETYETERFFLRVANWLHYNRGKKAWTYIADGYAVFLLFLALSGAFMLKGRKGILGRGAVLILLGAAVPVLYIHFTGGP